MVGGGEGRDGRVEDGGEWDGEDEDGGEVRGVVVVAVAFLGRLSCGGSARGDEEGESAGEVVGCTTGEERLR